jgi:hypothetical protein
MKRGDEKRRRKEETKRGDEKRRSPYSTSALHTHVARTTSYMPS